MTSKFGFPKEMFEIEGFGLTSPIAPNNVEDSRAKNRRIEIINTLQPLLVSTPALSKPLLEAKAKFLRSDREDLLSDDITLTQGDSVSIEFTPTRVVYAYVFWIDSTGSKALFPNKEFLKEENPLQPGKLYRIPKFGSWLKLDENKGRETIVIFAQETPLSNPDEVLSRLFRSSEGVRYADASSSKGPGGIRTPPAKQQSAALETSKAETAAKPSETADIDMSHIFSWKLSFHHE